MNGICTLANDVIYDQLVALLNSIEAVAGKEMPVCVYPYDDRIDRIAAEIARRPNVTLYDDRESIERWEAFAGRVWETHPTARQRWQLRDDEPYHRVGMHRRFCAFDGPFDRFIYMDGDTLLMDSVTPIFASLDRHDCVVYDFQHKDITHVYEESSSQLEAVFSPERLQSEIFCAGFYGSKKGLFDGEKRDWLVSQLQGGEAEILYPMAPDQTIVNYMFMRSQLSIYNFALNLPKEQRTGCCVTSPHFEAKENILFDRGNRLTYLHYIGIPSKVFGRLCGGENIDFPYREVFLHYRYLHEPEKRPRLRGTPQPYNRRPSFARSVLQKMNVSQYLKFLQA